MMGRHFPRLGRERADWIALAQRTSLLLSLVLIAWLAHPLFLVVAIAAVLAFLHERVVWLKRRVERIEALQDNPRRARRLLQKEKA
jgi:predicted PurR-regulated permease PerM